MRGIMTTLGQVIGAALVTIGFAHWSTPAGLVVGGTFVIYGCHKIDDGGE